MDGVVCVVAVIDGRSDEFLVGGVAITIGINAVPAVAVGVETVVIRIGGAGVDAAVGVVAVVALGGQRGESIPVVVGAVVAVAVGVPLVANVVVCAGVDGGLIVVAVVEA